MIQHDKGNRSRYLIFMQNHERLLSLLTVFAAGVFIFGMISILIPLKSISGSCSISKGPIFQLIGDGRGLLVWESCNLNSKNKLSWTGKANQTINGHYVHWGDEETSKMLFKTQVPIPPKLDQIEFSIGNINQNNFTVDLSAFQGKIKAVIVGDNQKGFAQLWLLAAKMASLNPNLFIHVGDMVQNPFIQSEWQRLFFDPLDATGLIPKIPVIITQGNHDVYGYNEISHYFSSIEDLHPEATGYYYAQSVGPLRIIVLDSNISDRDQIEWLREELSSEASRQAKFRIVCVHVAPFIEYWNPVAWQKGEHTWPYYVRNNMVRLFEEGKVDLVLSGHQHNYQRGYHKGVTYVVTGGGGGILDDQRVENFDYIYEKTVIQYHFMEMNADEHVLQLRMHQIDGIIGDEFTLKCKSP